MKIRLKVETPKGQAAGAEKKLRLVILGTLKKPCDTYVSPRGTSFYWDLEVTVKQYIKIGKNVAVFTKGLDKALDIKAVNKTLKTLADKPEDIDTLKEYLGNGTRISILKNATAEEIIEGNKTFWDTIKEKFQKRTVKP
jgi:hypothetical protein